MRAWKLLIGLCAIPAFAQLDSNSVTVAVQRTINIQPDQVVFSLSVTAPPDASLDDIVAALPGTGITAANFVGISQPLVIFDPAQPVIPIARVQPLAPFQWNFSLAVSISKWKDTLVLLNNLQQNLSRQNNGFSLQYGVQGLQVSQQLRQIDTCSSTDLISDARTQAQAMANAASLTLGPILATSDVPVTSGSIYAASRLVAVLSVITAQPQVCALAVKFALTRF